MTRLAWRGVVTTALAAALLGAGYAAPAAGQGAGSGATTLLRLAPGPRPLALGNAFTAIVDPVAVEYNPATLSGPASVGASYQGLPVDATAGAAVAAIPAGALTLGVSLRFLDYGEVAVIEPSAGLPVGVPTGEMASGSEVSALVGAALGFGPLRLGVAGRWLRQDVAGLSDATAAVDAGLLYSPVQWLDLGLSVQHLGPDMKAGRSAPLPRTVRVGAAMAGQVGTVDLRLVGEVRDREERTTGGAGIEAAVGGEAFEAALRVGYETRADPGDAYASFVVGGGLSLGPLTVDLAWRALGPLGATRQLGLRYTF